MHSNGYSLRPTAFCFYLQFSNGNSTDSHSSGVNNTNDTQGDENLEPASKRRKIRGNGESPAAFEGKLLSRELVVYDKHSKCLLTEGEYELVLSEVDAQGNSIRKNPSSSWENISLDKSDKVCVGRLHGPNYLLMFSYAPWAYLVE